MAWEEHGLAFARDGYRLRGGSRPPGGPQDPGRVSSRWRRLQARIGLPEDFRIHDLRHSYVTNALDAGENLVEGLRERPPPLTGLHDGNGTASAAAKAPGSWPQPTPAAWDCPDWPDGRPLLTSAPPDALVRRLVTHSPGKRKTPDQQGSL